MSGDPIADVMAECRIFLERQSVEPGLIGFITPPKREYGDLATNVAFRLAKVWRKAPRLIAEELVRGFDPASYILLSAAEAVEGFINFRIRAEEFAQRTLHAIQGAGTRFGGLEQASKDKVGVEHTSVNPTKPWHIGHARNAILGDTVARILAMAGCDVEVQNYINDAGRQVGEAMFALSYFGAPDVTDDRYDHFLARYYVRMNALLTWGKECEAQIMTYMKLANNRLGLLMNFNVMRLKQSIKRIIL